MAREWQRSDEEAAAELTNISRRGCLQATSVGAIAAISGMTFGTGSVTADTEGGPMDRENWTLTFEDRFESRSLDPRYWGIGFGWGRKADGDDASVVDEDVYIENDQLVLEINHHGSGEFTQGVVNTGSADGVSWSEPRADEGVLVGPGTYIEARIKPATRSGVLPAFWTKPNNENWPPEIDIFENFNYGNEEDSHVAHAELHYSESGKSDDESTKTSAGMGSYDAGHDLGTEWHVYGCEWREDEIKFYFDGELYDSTSNPAILDAFNRDGLPHYLMFSNHVNRLGRADESRPWTEETRVDWCRVWEYEPDAESPSGSEDEGSAEDGPGGVLVDDCSNLATLHPSSDRDALFVDSSNSSYFKRNDGSCADDGARIARAETTDDVSMVYEPEGPISAFRAEAHNHAEHDGSVAFYASTDSGDSWTELSPGRTEYCGVQAGWHHVEYTAQSLPEGTDRLRIVLSGATASWTAQVGHVEIKYGDGSEPDSETGDEEETADAGLENTILFDGVGTVGETQYKFSVTGDVERSTYRGASINGEDTIVGARVTGTIGGWRDAYRFSGDLEELTVDGQSRVSVNGEQVDPAEFGGEDSQVVTIVGNGTRSVYELAADGEIDVIEGDRTVVSEGRAEGTIERGVHRFRLAGDLVDFAFREGGTQVYLDGQRIDPDDYSGEQVLPHAIVFDGTDAPSSSQYSFTVDGDVTKAEYHGASIDGSGTIDASTVDGVVGSGETDAYWFDGRIADFKLAGAADVDIEYDIR